MPGGLIYDDPGGIIRFISIDCSENKSDVISTNKNNKSFFSVIPRIEYLNETEILILETTNPRWIYNCFISFPIFSDLKPAALLITSLQNMKWMYDAL